MEMLDAACLSACSLSGKRLLALTVPTAVIFVDVRHQKKKTTCTLHFGFNQFKRGGDLPESHLTHTIFVQGVANINGSASSSARMDGTTKAMGTVFGAKYCRESRPDVFDTKYVLD